MRDVTSESGTALQARALTRRFGGLTAVNAVSLTVAPKSVHAVIGPNGAGKSTLINLLSGDLRPSSGTLHLGDADLTSLTPAERSHRGIGRSYQKTNIFKPFSAFENCRLAAQSRRPRAARWLTDAARYDDLRDAASASLTRVGLEARADIAAGRLSHGEQRQLEIAMALATQPEVLLLDEPLAGMGADEAERMIALLAELGRAHALLLVEHDMDAVFALAQTLTVMVNGSVIASGDPATVRANTEVQHAYLGDDVGDDVGDDGGAGQTRNFP